MIGKTKDESLGQQKGHMITECRRQISKGKDKKRCLNQECS